MEKNMSNAKVGILGYGEIGKAVSQFYASPKIKDLNRDDGLAGVEILHVCIPWSDKFIDIVKKEIKKIKPKLTIIHSTVALSATKEIGGTAVHSPVRGVHPKLFEGIKTFVKYIGADNKRAANLAERHFKKLNIKTKTFFPSKTTEALKLWDTAQYGWLIVLNKEIKKWCDKNNVDFEAVYTEANKTYNEGYKKLGREEVLRPYLKHIEGKIGGHCIIPNCRILKSGITETILKKNGIL